MKHPFEAIVPQKSSNDVTPRWRAFAFGVFSLWALFVRPDQALAEDATTLAVGEEGGGGGISNPTSLSLEEEGGHSVSTQAVGEEGGGVGGGRPGPGIATTQAVGEEGGVSRFNNSCQVARPNR